jgi:hypothetical protein
MAVKRKLRSSEKEASGEYENGYAVNNQYQPKQPFLTPTPPPPPPPSFHFHLELDSNFMINLAIYIYIYGKLIRRRFCLNRLIS